MTQGSVKNTTGYVNYVYNISARGTTQVASQLLGLSGVTSNILGQLAFQTSSYLSTTEGALLSMGVVATAGFAKATKQATEFDQALATIGAISGKTTSEVSGLGEEAMTMSSRFGMAVDEMTKGLESLARAGVSTGNMNAILEQAMGLSKLEGLSLETAINSLISTTNLLDTQGLDLESPEYVDAVKRQNQRITATSEAAPINAQDIIHTLEHVGGYASSTNLDQDDLFAVIAQLGSKGTKSEMAGTSLRAFLAAGQKDTAQRALKRIGLKVSDLWKDDDTIMSITDMKDVLDEAMEAKGYTKQEKLEFYSDFAGYKQANQIMKIDTTSAREFKEKIDRSWDMSKKIQQIIGTAETNIKGLVQAGTNLLTKVGQPLLPIVSVIAGTTKTIIDIINKIPGANIFIAGGVLLASIKSISIIFNKIAPQLLAAKGNVFSIGELFSNLKGDLEDSFLILKNINNIDWLKKQSIWNESQRVTDKEKILYWKENTDDDVDVRDIVDVYALEKNRDYSTTYRQWKYNRSIAGQEERNQRQETKNEPTGASESSNNRESNSSVVTKLDDILYYLKNLEDPEGLYSIGRLFPVLISNVSGIRGELAQIKTEIPNIVKEIKNHTFRVVVTNPPNQVVPVHEVGQVNWGKFTKKWYAEHPEPPKSKRVENDNTERKKFGDPDKHRTSDEVKARNHRRSRKDREFRGKHSGTVNESQIKSVPLFTKRNEGFARSGRLSTFELGENDIQNFLNSIEIDFGFDKNTAEGKKAQLVLEKYFTDMITANLMGNHINFQGLGDKQLKNKIAKELADYMDYFRNSKVGDAILDQIPNVKLYTEEDLENKLSIPTKFIDRFGNVNKKQGNRKITDAKRKNFVEILERGQNPLTKTITQELVDPEGKTDKEYISNIYSQIGDDYTNMLFVDTLDVNDFDLGLADDGIERTPDDLKTIRKLKKKAFFKAHPKIKDRFKNIKTEYIIGVAKRDEDFKKEIEDINNAKKELYELQSKRTKEYNKLFKEKVIIPEHIQGDERQKLINEKKQFIKEQLAPLDKQIGELNDSIEDDTDVLYKQALQTAKTNNINYTPANLLSTESDIDLAILNRMFRVSQYANQNENLNIPFAEPGKKDVIHNFSSLDMTINELNAIGKALQSEYGDEIELEKVKGKKEEKKEIIQKNLDKVLEETNGELSDAFYRRLKNAFKDADKPGKYDDLLNAIGLNYNDFTEEELRLLAHIANIDVGDRKDKAGVAKKIMGIVRDELGFESFRAGAVDLSQMERYNPATGKYEKSDYISPLAVMESLHTDKLANYFLNDLDSKAQQQWIKEQELQNKDPYYAIIEYWSRVDKNKKLINYDPFSYSSSNQKDLERIKELGNIVEVNSTKLDLEKGIYSQSIHSDINTTSNQNKDIERVLTLIGEQGWESFSLHMKKVGDASFEMAVNEALPYIEEALYEEVMQMPKEYQDKYLDKKTGKLKKSVIFKQIRNLHIPYRFKHHPHQLDSNFNEDDLATTIWRGAQNRHDMIRSGEPTQTATEGAGRHMISKLKFIYDPDDNWHPFTGRGNFLEDAEKAIRNMNYEQFVANTLLEEQRAPFNKHKTAKITGINARWKDTNIQMLERNEASKGRNFKNAAVYEDINGELMINPPAPEYDWISKEEYDQLVKKHLVDRTVGDEGILDTKIDKKTKEKLYKVANISQQAKFKGFLMNEYGDVREGYNWALLQRRNRIYTQGRQKENFAHMAMKYGFSRQDIMSQKLTPEQEKKVKELYYSQEFVNLEDYMKNHTEDEFKQIRGQMALSNKYKMTKKGLEKAGNIFHSWIDVEEYKRRLKENLIDTSEGYKGVLDTKVDKKTGKIQYQVTDFESLHYSKDDLKAMVLLQDIKRNKELEATYKSLQITSKTDHKQFTEQLLKSGSKTYQNIMDSIWIFNPEFANLIQRYAQNELDKERKNRTQKTSRRVLKTDTYMNDALIRSVGEAYGENMLEFLDSETLNEWKELDVEDLGASVDDYVENLIDTGVIDERDIEKGSADFHTVWKKVRNEQERQFEIASEILSQQYDDAGEMYSTGVTIGDFVDPRDEAFKSLTYDPEAVQLLDEAVFAGDVVYNKKRNMWEPTFDFYEHERASKLNTLLGTGNLDEYLNQKQITENIENIETINTRVRNQQKKAQEEAYNAQQELLNVSANLSGVSKEREKVKNKQKTSNRKFVKPLNDEIMNIDTESYNNIQYGSGYRSYEQSVNFKNELKKTISDAINNSADKLYQKTDYDNTNITRDFDQLSNKLHHTSESLGGISKLLDELAQAFPPLITVVIALQGVISAITTTANVAAKVRDFLNIETFINSSTKKNPFTFLNKEIKKNSTSAKLLISLSSILGSVLDKIKTFIMGYLGPLSLLTAGLIGTKIALDMSYDSHQKYLKKLQDEEKENKSRSKSLQTITEQSKKAAEQNKAERQQDRLNRNYALNRQRLINANITRTSGAFKLSNANNDTLWGSYGVAAALDKIQGKYESTASEYDGTSGQIRRIKESTTGGQGFMRGMPGYFSPSQSQVASYYDMNQLAISVMDEYKDELGQLYDAETTIMKKNKISSAEARETIEFKQAVDRFVEATGITEEHAKQYLDYMQTEHNVDKAVQAMQAQADNISATTDMKIQAISFGGNPSDVLGLNGIEAQQNAMIQAQADMIQLELSSQLWWKAVWSTLTSPFRLIHGTVTSIAHILSAIWSFVTGNWDAAGMHMQQAGASLNVLGETATYWGAWGEAESTNFNAIGQGATDEYNRANYGNVGAAAGSGYMNARNPEDNSIFGIFPVGGYKKGAHGKEAHKDILKQNEQQNFFSKLIGGITATLGTIVNILMIGAGLWGLDKINNIVDIKGILKNIGGKYYPTLVKYFNKIPFAGTIKNLGGRVLGLGKSFGNFLGLDKAASFVGGFIPKSVRDKASGLLGTVKGLFGFGDRTDTEDEETEDETIEDTDTTKPIEENVSTISDNISSILELIKQTFSPNKHRNAAVNKRIKDDDIDELGEYGEDWDFDFDDDEIEIGDAIEIDDDILNLSLKDILETERLKASYQKVFSLLQKTIGEDVDKLLFENLEFVIEHNEDESALGSMFFNTMTLNTAKILNPYDLVETYIHEFGHGALEHSSRTLEGKITSTDGDYAYNAAELETRIATQEFLKQMGVKIDPGEEIQLALDINKAKEMGRWDEVKLPLVDALVQDMVKNKDAIFGPLINMMQDTQSAPIKEMQSDVLDMLKSFNINPDMSIHRPLNDLGFPYDSFEDLVELVEQGTISKENASIFAAGRVKGTLFNKKGGSYDEYDQARRGAFSSARLRYRNEFITEDEYEEELSQLNDQVNFIPKADSTGLFLSALYSNFIPRRLDYGVAKDPTYEYDGEEYYDPESPEWHEQIGFDASTHDYDQYSNYTKIWGQDTYPFNYQMNKFLRGEIAGTTTLSELQPDWKDFNLAKEILGLPNEVNADTTIAELTKTVIESLNTSTGLMDNMVLYRGGYLDIEDGTNIGTFGQITSTTYSKNQAEEYKGQDEDNYLIRIFAGAGTKGLANPGAPGEFTLAPGQEYLVLERNKETMEATVLLLTKEQSEIYKMLQQREELQRKLTSYSIKDNKRTEENEEDNLAMTFVGTRHHKASKNAGIGDTVTTKLIDGTVSLVNQDGKVMGVLPQSNRKINEVQEQGLPLQKNQDIRDNEDIYDKSYIITDILEDSMIAIREKTQSDYNVGYEEYDGRKYVQKQFNNTDDWIDYIIDYSTFASEKDESDWGNVWSLGLGYTRDDGTHVYPWNDIVRGQVDPNISLKDYFENHEYDYMFEYFQDMLELSDDATIGDVSNRLLEILSNSGQIGEDTIAYRAGHLSANVGESGTLSGITSTSLIQEGMEDYLTDDKYAIKMLIPKEMQGIYNPQSNEFTLPPNMAYDVLEKDEENKTATIKLAVPQTQNASSVSSESVDVPTLQQLSLMPASQESNWDILKDKIKEKTKPWEDYLADKKEKYATPWGEFLGNKAKSFMLGFAGGDDLDTFNKKKRKGMNKSDREYLNEKYNLGFDLDSFRTSKQANKAIRDKLDEQGKWDEAVKGMYVNKIKERYVTPWKEYAKDQVKSRVKQKHEGIKEEAEWYRQGYISDEDVSGSAKWYAKGLDLKDKYLGKGVGIGSIDEIKDALQDPNKMEALIKNKLDSIDSDTPIGQYRDKIYKAQELAQDPEAAIDYIKNSDYFKGLKQTASMYNTYPTINGQSIFDVEGSGYSPFMVKTMGKAMQWKDKYLGEDSIQDVLADPARVDSIIKGTYEDIQGGALSDIGLDDLSIGNTIREKMAGIFNSEEIQDAVEEGIDEGTEGENGGLFDSAKKKLAGWFEGGGEEEYSWYQDADAISFGDLSPKNKIQAIKDKAKDSIMGSKAMDWYHEEPDEEYQWYQNDDSLEFQNLSAKNQLRAIIDTKGEVLKENGLSSLNIGSEIKENLIGKISNVKDSIIGKKDNTISSANDLVNGAKNKISQWYSGGGEEELDWHDNSDLIGFGDLSPKNKIEYIKNKVQETKDNQKELYTDAEAYRERPDMFGDVSDEAKDLAHGLDTKDKISGFASKAKQKITGLFNRKKKQDQNSSGNICPSCGYENDPNAIYCEECGTLLKTFSADDVKRKGSILKEQGYVHSDPSGGHLDGTYGYTYGFNDINLHPKSLKGLFGRNIESKAAKTTFHEAAHNLLGHDDKNRPELKDMSYEGAGYETHPYELEAETAAQRAMKELNIPVSLGDRINLKARKIATHIRHPTYRMNQEVMDEAHNQLMDNSQHLLGGLSQTAAENPDLWGSRSVKKIHNLYENVTGEKFDGDVTKRLMVLPTTKDSSDNKKSSKSLLSHITQNENVTNAGQRIMTGESPTDVAKDTIKEKLTGGKEGVEGANNALKTGGKLASKAGNFLSSKGGKLGKVGNVLSKVGGGASKAGTKGIGSVAKKGGGKLLSKAGGSIAKKGGSKLLGKVGSKVAGKVGSKLASKGIAHLASKGIAAGLAATGVGAPLAAIMASPVGGFLVEGAMNLGGKALGAIGGVAKGIGNFLGFGRKLPGQKGGGGLPMLGGLGAMMGLGGMALGGLGRLFGGGPGNMGKAGGIGMMKMIHPLTMMGGLLGSILKVNKTSAQHSENIDAATNKSLSEMRSAKQQAQRVDGGSGGNITIQNININTADDPEAIKAMFLELIIELQEQVNPRMVSRTVGKPDTGDSENTTPTDEENSNNQGNTTNNNNSNNGGNSNSNSNNSSSNKNNSNAKKYIQNKNDSNNKQAAKVLNVVRGAMYKKPN